MLKHLRVPRSKCGTYSLSMICISVDALGFFGLTATTKAETSVMTTGPRHHHRLLPTSGEPRHPCYGRGYHPKVRHATILCCTIPSIPYHTVSAVPFQPYRNVDTSSGKTSDIENPRVCGFGFLRIGRSARDFFFVWEFGVGPCRQPGEGCFLVLDQSELALH